MSLSCKLVEVFAMIYAVLLQNQAQDSVILSTKSRIFSRAHRISVNVCISVNRTDDLDVEVLEKCGRCTEVERRRLVALDHVQSVASSRRLARVNHVDMERRTYTDGQRQAHADRPPATHTHRYRGSNVNRIAAKAISEF